MTSRRGQTAGDLVWRLTTKRVSVDRTLNRFALTPAHYLVLSSLSDFSRSDVQPNLSELAERAGLDVLPVAKLVRALERSGLLRRADHPDDPGAIQLELTARGAGLVEHAAAVMQKLFDQLLGPIGGRSGKRHAALIRTLDALLDEPNALSR
jgi:DNA-binding MarR family transcriptional regulator